MGKRVVIRLDGYLEQGFTVTLEVGEEGNVHFTEVTGHLPPSPELLQSVDLWQTNYRQLSETTRITLKKVAVQTGTLSQIETCRQLAQDLQGYLKNWLDSPEFQGIEKRLREVLNQEESIRILLRTQDNRLRKLPWHLWEFIEKYSKAEIAFSTSPERVKETKTFTHSKKVRILAILGDSDGIDTNADRKLLESLPNAEVLFLVETSWQNINSQLWEKSWDILFFAGHSKTEDNRGRIYINPHDSLTLDQLKYGLRQAIAQGLQLAIFNSCDGLGLAYELEQLHLPQLIVMREPVPDQVAQEFLKHFLTAFASGDSLYFAVRKARERLQWLEGKFPCATWLPVICQNPAEIPPTWQELVGEQINPSVSRPVDGVDIPMLLPSTSPPTRRKKPKLRVVLAVSLLVASLLIGVRSLGLLESSELWAYDRFMKLQSAPAMNEKVLVVAVNDEDIQQFKKPLSDQIITQLLTKLRKYQPRVIGLDIYRDIPQGTKEDWENLGKGIQNSSAPIVPVCVVGEVEGQFQPLMAIQPPPKVSSKNLGFADGLMRDSDNVIRRYSLMMALRPESPCSTEYSFSLQVARHFISSRFTNKLKPGEDLHINSKVLNILQPDSGAYQRAKNKMPGSQILINYYPPKQLFQEISLKDVINGHDSDLIPLIRGRVVLIGYVVTNTKDFHPTPIGKMHGVRIHAQVVSQILDMIENKHHHPLLSYWSGVGENFWIFYWSFIGGFCARLFRLLLSFSISILVSYLFLSGICFIYFTHAIWIPIIPSILGFLLTSMIIFYPLLSYLKMHLNTLRIFHKNDKLLLKI